MKIIMMIINLMIINKMSVEDNKRTLDRMYDLDYNKRIVDRAIDPYEKLIVNYNPIVVFSPDEKHYPLSIDKYIQSSDVGEFTGDGKLIRKLKDGPFNQQTLYDYSLTIQNWEGVSLQLRDDETVRKEPFDRTAPVYVNYYEENEMLYMNFVYFFAYDTGKVGRLHLYDHQADAEHITFEFPKDAAEKSLPPIRVYLSAHGFAEGTWWKYDDLQTDKILNRKIIYCAEGSHGFYGKPGDNAYFRYYGFGNDNTSDRGYRLLADPVLVSGHNIQIPLPDPNTQWANHYPFKDSIRGDVRFLTWGGSMGQNNVNIMDKQAWWNSNDKSTGLNPPKSYNYTLYMAAIITAGILFLILVIIIIYLIVRKRDVAA